MKFNLLSLLIAFALLTQKTEAQNKIRAFEFLGGYATHGSGDMRGVTFGGGYLTYLSKKLSLNFNMRAHINSRKDELVLFSNAFLTGRRDASVRSTTAGVQLGVDGGWSFLRTKHNEIMISIGGFARYQSASEPDGYSLFPPGSMGGYPSYLVAYDNHSPQETITAGYIVQFRYNYTFKNNMYIGLLPGWQNDTNGDIITQVALTVGKRI